MGANLINDAIEHHKQGRVKEAQALYERILKTEPDNINALYLSALTFCASAEFAKAYEYVKKAINIAPQVDLYKLLGEICYELGKYDESLAAYQKIANVAVDSDDLFYRMGLVYHKLKRPNFAEQAYLKALDLNPDSPEILSNLGAVLCEQKKYLEAVKHYEKALKIKPNDSSLYFNIGNALRELGYLKNSLEYYKKALELKPNDAVACQLLAESYYLLKDFDNSFEVYMRLKQLCPDNIELMIKAGNEIRYRMWMHEREKAVNNSPESYPGINIGVITYGDEEKSTDSLDGYTHIGFVESGDKLHEDAIRSVARLFNDNPDLEIVYTDEDVINEQGKRECPHFKTQYAPYLLLSQNYMDAFLCVKLTDRVKEELSKIGNITYKSLYKLVLNLTDAGAKAHRIPDVLYHRSIKNYLKRQKESGYDIVQEYIDQKSLNAKIIETNSEGCVQVKFFNTITPKVSIIIPFKDKLDVTRVCVESIEKKSTYKNYEIILVNNRSEEPKTLDYLRKTSHKVIDADIPFNFAQLNNIAAQQAEGEYLVFLNNDMEIISPDWIESSLGLAQRPEVGLVGAKLIREGELLQHAGMIYTKKRRQFFHINNFHPANDGGYRQYANLVREYSGQTGAFMMIEKDKFFKLGMFDEQFTVVKNDVDLCFKSLEQGYLNIYNAQARVYHYESLTRKSNAAITPESAQYFQQRWDAFLSNDDKYYNPNLSWAFCNYVTVVG